MCSEPKGQQACSHPLQVEGSRMDSGAREVRGLGRKVADLERDWRETGES